MTLDELNLLPSFAETFFTLAVSSALISAVRGKRDERHQACQPTDDGKVCRARRQCLRLSMKAANSFCPPQFACLRILPW